MTDAPEPRPLAEFLAAPEATIARLRSSGDPESFSVEGGPPLVLMDAGAYAAQRVADEQDPEDRERMIAAVREAVAEADAGAKRYTLDEAMDHLRGRVGV